MTEEIELATQKTALVRGATDTKMGQMILTSDRVVFVQQKFAGGAAGGALGVAIADRLQKHAETEGPLLEVPLDTIVGLAREKKLFNKDRLRVRTTDGEFLFNEGWKDITPLLCDALRQHHGRTVTAEGDDAWTVG